jgi:hypothetical protein
VLAFSLSDYINPGAFPWQIPLLLVALAGWLLGGPWLLRWTLAKKNLLGKLKYPNLMLHIFLAGVSAVAVGAAVFFFITTIGTAAQISLTIPAAIAALPVALIAAYLVLYAMLNLSLAKAVSVGTLPLGAIIVLGAAMAVACALPALYINQEQRWQEGCRRNMKTIYGEITADSIHIPPSLEYLVEKGKIKPQDVRCPSCQTRQIGYCYLPPKTIKSILERSKEASFELRLCDFAGNHKGIRNIVTNDGQVQAIKEADFQALLARPENAAFAKALAEAEKK